ncbi:MAG: hypothetical protein M9891_03585 [Austwickia sp.]|nr:polyamine aminopropyltransferase [Actinomycetota bacterium]MCO5308370.1 hypothetical protein [Austwickia sp.]
MVWFTEAELPGGSSGIRVSIEVTAQLVDERTEFGHIAIYDSPFFGRFLALDGIVQVSESDEFIYHEMMVTLPGLLHGAPQRVLILGGGDGGALKHALGFPSCRAATQVEIDDRVRELCAQYLPSVSSGAFEDPRARLVCGDAYEAVTATDETFDVITLDLTDPVPDGPAARLFQAEYLAAVRDRLTETGIAAIHCGSLLFQEDEVTQMTRMMAEVFPHSTLRSAVVPTYQLSPFGFLYGSRAPLPDLTDAEYDARAAQLTLAPQFLNARMLAATAALPTYQERRFRGTA